MITTLVLSLAASAAVPAPLPAAAAQPVRPPARVAFAQGEELDRDEFMKRFRRALDARAESEMESLVRRNQGIAAVLIIEICEQIARETNERLETEMAALRKAWRVAVNTDFAENMYEYFSLMRLQVRAFRAQKKQDFEKFAREYDQAVADKSWDRLDVACDKFAALAEAFEQAGDHYYVSECWWRVAQGYDDGLRGNQANYEKAAEAYEKCLQARTEIDLKDRFYSAAKLRSDQFKGQKRREEEKAGEAAKEGYARRKPGVALGEEVAHDLEFALLEDLEETVRPGYDLLELPVVWTSLTFQRPGSTTAFHTFEGGPQAIRTGSGVAIDVDRDGRGEAEITLTGNIEPTELTLGDGDTLRKWGFLSVVLTDQEIYQGIGLPLQASEAFLSLYIAPAASMVGEIDGTTVRVIDDNMDGVYGSQPKYWSLAGLTPESRQPTLDSVLIDEGKRAVPWSEYLEIDSQWYQMLSDQGGTRLVTAKAKVETGKLKVKTKGISSPLYLVVKGAGTFEYSFFDVMAGGSRGIEVPAGSYTLVCGEIRKGKRTQVVKALILPGAETKPWTVDPGETTEIELGAPFDFDFSATEKGDKVTVVGQSVAPIGKSGERYERLWNCVVAPEVFVRKVGTKKGGRGKSMETVKDYQMIFDLGFPVAWFPLDLEVEKRSADEPVELQMVEKKNELFGKIESTWKPVSK